MNEIFSWLDRLLEFSMPHLVAVPILVPMLTAALMLLLGEQRRRTKSALSVLSGLIGLLAALALLRWVNAADTGGGPGSIGVYLPGNWKAPFGIVLVADRLSTMMVALTGVIAFAASIYSTSRWDRAGVHFHPLLQLQLMGLNGAFLTGDLFNLFVFFEVMLAASYGLLLHGSGRLRVQAGLHYIAINLGASSLFLIGAAMLYGATGTLNMADLGMRIAEIAPGDRGLVHAAAAILATAFFAKAGAWPLNFWLVPAYSAAVSPVGAVFALLTKLGVYTLLRLWTTLFAPDTGASAQFGEGVLIAIGLATIFVGALGIVGTQRLSNLAGFSVLISAGTLITAVGLGDPSVWAGALYYLISSTLAVSAFFLLIDMVERWRNAGASIAPHETDAPYLAEDLKPISNVNLDDEQQALYGRAIPAGIAFLGLAFIGCTLLLAGLPPLSGFVGKFAMLSGLLDARTVSAAGVTFMVLLIGSGFLSLIALSRAGIRHFWTQIHETMPALPALEVLPVAALLAATIALTAAADPVMQHATATADGTPHRRRVPQGGVRGAAGRQPRAQAGGQAMKRWMPSPPLSLALFAVWLLLNQSLDAATLLLAALLAVVVPLITRSLRPAQVRMRRPGLALQLTGRVVLDLGASAGNVARLLLTRRTEAIRAAFVRVPLDMRDPNGLAVLAMILCLTPGTAWGEVSFDRSTLLIHVFDLDDEAAFIALIKTRYERPLMEIFES